MKNQTTKIKVQQATPEEIATIMAQAIAKLESATVGELQASLTAIAESFIGLTTECPDQQTRRVMAMAFILRVLDENAGAVSLQDSIPIEDLEPLTCATN